MERPPHDEVMACLEDVERIAEDVLSDRQLIVDLDRRRNKTREALRVLHKDKSTDKAWVCMGSMFIKLPKPQTKQLLQKDFDRLDEEITALRQALKPKVNKLRDLENKDAPQGFTLNPLSKQEMQALDSVL